MSFARSDWLLKPGIINCIHLNFRSHVYMNILGDPGRVYNNCLFVQDSDTVTVFKTFCFMIKLTGYVSTK